MALGRRTFSHSSGQVPSCDGNGSHGQAPAAALEQVGSRRKLLSLPARSRAFVEFGSSSQTPRSADDWDVNRAFCDRSGSISEMEAYERLLTDATRGDALLFVRQDAVEAAWAI